MADDNTIEGFAERRRKQREAEQATLITLDVRQHPDVEDPFLVGSLKLKGDLPVKKDLHTGDRLTVQVAGPDGGVIASGVFEVGLPAFKPITQKGVGLIGTERVHSADFAADL